MILAEAGHKNGPAVILLHGWPYDSYSFVNVAPMLAAAAPPTPALRMVLSSSCCMTAPTTATALLTSRRCWPRRATAGTEWQLHCAREMRGIIRTMRGAGRPVHAGVL